MNIALPASVVMQAKSQTEHESAATTTTITSTTAAMQAVDSPAQGNNGGKKSSNLDHVLKQLAGPKKLNTVEKTSGDWEGFKATDKTLQDELERTAQSKDAYLVKQDFLNRVDQRRFELEREERDQERARRQLAAASGSKK